MKTMKKHSNRAGCQKCKVLFSINISGIILPNDSAISPGSVISICFERGGKISTTKNKVLEAEKCENIEHNGSNVLFFPIEEKVELVSTIFKDIKTGQYQSKTGKIILRQLKKNNLFGVDSYKGFFYVFYLIF
jgi:hypothetical protein